MEYRYRGAPEPELVGHSVTVKASEADIKKLYRDAEATWTPAFVDLIKVHSTCLYILPTKNGTRVDDRQQTLDSRS